MLCVVVVVVGLGLSCHFGFFKGLFLSPGFAISVSG